MRYTAKAFSLIELLVAIVLVAAMLLVVTPSWRALIAKNHAVSYANDIMMALQFARSTAIKSGKPVGFCPSKNHKECGGLWKDGSIVITSGGVIVRVLPPIFYGDKLRWNHDDSIIEFSSDGFSKGEQGSFFYCPKNSSENARAIILSPMGRVRVSAKTHDGKEIPCNF